ncbi:MAG: M23 family metallopeptidase, partial [Gemmatimonadota bacterium]
MKSDDSPRRGRRTRSAAGTIRLWPVPLAFAALAATAAPGSEDDLLGEHRTRALDPSAVGVGRIAVPAVDARPHAIETRWSPERPAQGTVFTIRVEPVDVPLEHVEGEFAGEPLHFRPAARADDDGAFTALAAVPVDAEGERTLRIHVRTVPGHRETVERSVPIAPGDYRMEELSVAPRYGGGYDAETRARISREYRRAVAVSRASHDTPRMWEPPFVAPRPTPITSGFGNGRIFNGELQSRHTGTDFAGGLGAPVRAPARGIVRLVDAFYLGGNVVYIDHGAGLVTGYLHLSEAVVAEGDTVDAGTVIGRVGATGRVTGPHLHWIVRYGEISVDGLSLPGLRDGADAPSP